MCDNCKDHPEVVYHNITSACKYIYSIIEKAEKQEVHLTLLKLLDAWFKTGDKNLRVENVKQPNVERHHAEIIIAYLLMKGFLMDYKSYTAYATNCYIQKGRGRRLTDDTVIEMPLPADIKMRGFAKRSATEDADSETKRIKID